MKVICKCKFCNEDIVFLRSTHGKPEPVSPNCLTLADLSTLLEEGFLRFDYRRHVCHLQNCRRKGIDLQVLAYMNRLTEFCPSF